MKFSAFITGMCISLLFGLLLTFYLLNEQTHRAEKLNSMATKQVQICESSAEADRLRALEAEEAAEAAKADLYKLEFEHFETLAECASVSADLRELRLFVEQGKKRRHRAEAVTETKAPETVQ